MPVCPNCREYYSGTPDRCPRCDAILVTKTPAHQTEELRRIPAWGYVGYTILYAIPIIGWIILIVHTFKKGNPVRRSFARSFWCWLLLAAAVSILSSMLGLRGIGGLGSFVGNNYRRTNSGVVSSTVRPIDAPEPTNAPEPAQQSEPTDKPTTAPTKEPFAPLQRGDSGDAVKDVQTRLIDLGWLSGSADGKFGGGTESAVKAFQAAAGLTADGIVTEATNDRLFGSSAPEPTESPTKAPKDEPKNETKGTDISAFKKTMDKYEDFFDDYIDFMTSFDANTSSITALTKYAKMLSDYTEMMEEFEAIGDDDLTDAEMAYYIDVQTRVMNKLMKASLAY